MQANGVRDQGLMDPAEAAENLEQQETGFWVARSRTRLEYPEKGNERALAIEERSFWFRHRNACIVEVIRALPPCGTLVDVGGGNGFVSLAIRNSGVEVMLVEPGEVGARTARERGISLVVCATLEDARFRAHSMPAIGLFDVLEHVKEDVGYLAVIKKLLVPGGRLYLTVPAHAFLWSSEDEVARHHRRYSLSELTGKMAQAGFVVEFATHIFALLPMPIFFLRTIPDRLGLRKTADPETERREHASPPGMFGALLERTLGLELSLLRAGARIPVGGSCLVVARAAGR